MLLGFGVQNGREPVGVAGFGTGDAEEQRSPASGGGQLARLQARELHHQLLRNGGPHGRTLGRWRAGPSPPHFQLQSRLVRRLPVGRPHQVAEAQSRSAGLRRFVHYEWPEPTKLPWGSQGHISSSSSWAERVRSKSSAARGGSCGVKYSAGLNTDAKYLQ